MSTKDLLVKGTGSSPMQRSSPLGYLRNACSPRKRGDRGPFSNGYMIVYGGRKNCSKTIHIPKKGGITVRIRPNHQMMSVEDKPTSYDLCEEEHMDCLLNCAGAILVGVGRVDRFLRRKANTQRRGPRFNYCLDVVPHLCV